MMVSVAESAAAAAKRKRREPPPETYADRAKRFRASAEWRKLRYTALAANAKRHGGTARCELCGRSRRDGAILHADHIEPLSRNWSRRLDPTNIQIMCDTCNLGKSNRDDADFRPPEEPAAAQERPALRLLATQQTLLALALNPHAC